MTVPSTSISRGDDADAARWLASGAGFPSTAPVERIDTHAASIFLHGDRAWKIKRAVSLGYLDFSTVERRKLALDAEMRLNRRTAPGLYRAVHAITRLKDGGLALDGEGEIIDWVLEMRRFPADALLEQALKRGAINDHVLVDLADAIVAFHRDADVCATGSGAMRLRVVIDGNERAMARYPDILPHDRVEALTGALVVAIGMQAQLLDARAQGGRIRHCHGDLHLENIALIDGKATPFDCIEFDPELATCDVLYDLAFLLMDLCERGCIREANILNNRYLDRSADDEEGGGLMSLFMAVRASVRAHVLASQASLTQDKALARDRALRYLACAERLMKPEPPRLVAIGGLSGTGKSTLARSLGGMIGGPPGARILRSDVLRKRLAGIPPEERLPSTSYTQAASDRVYDEIGCLAAQALAQGRSVIADAMFSKPRERRAIASIAQAEGCRFDGLWLRAMTEERINRVNARPIDASDADAGVAKAQARMKESIPTDWSTLETGCDFSLLQSAASKVLNVNFPKPSA